LQVRAGVRVLQQSSWPGWRSIMVGHGKAVGRTFVGLVNAGCIASHSDPHKSSSWSCRWEATASADHVTPLFKASSSWVCEDCWLTKLLGLGAHKGAQPVLGQELACRDTRRGIGLCLECCSRDLEGMQDTAQNGGRQQQCSCNSCMAAPQLQQLQRSSGSSTEQVANRQQQLCCQRSPEVPEMAGGATRKRAGSLRSPSYCGKGAALA